MEKDPLIPPAKLDSPVVADARARDEAAAVAVRSSSHDADLPPGHVVGSRDGFKEAAKLSLLTARCQGIFAYGAPSLGSPHMAQPSRKAALSEESQHNHNRSPAKRQKIKMKGTKHTSSRHRCNGRSTEL